MALGHALAVTQNYASDRNVANAAIQVMLALAEQGEPRAIAWCARLHADVERRIGDEA